MWPFFRFALTPLMASPAFSPALWSYGLTGVSYSVLAVQLSRSLTWRSVDRSAVLAFLAAVALSASWGWLGAGLALKGSSAVAVLALVDCLRIGSWFACLLLLLQPQKRVEPNRGLAVVGLASVGLLAFDVSVQVAGLLGVSFVNDASRWVLFASMLLSIAGLVLVEQLFRSVPDDTRWHAKPLCLALAGVFLFDLYAYSQAVLFNRIDTNAMSMRGAAHALVVPMLWLSIARRQDWLARLYVSRNAVFHSAALTIAGLYLAFVAIVGYYVRYFGGTWGGAFQVGLIFCALLLLSALALSGTARAKLRVFVGKNFFRYRYDYREEWLRFTRTLSAQSTPRELGERVVHGLADMVESPGGELWIKDIDESAYRQAAFWNAAPKSALEPADSPFCRFMQDRRWVVHLGEHRLRPALYGGLVLPEGLAANARAWLVVPLCVGDDLAGFVVLAEPRTAIDIDWEVNDLLKTAGSQAASFLATMRATEALLEARKFESFHRMSAFVVHDLKNIVTQLSLMMANAKRLHANPDFQQDMLATVENSLGRMRQLMLQLSEGQPAESACSVDLGNVVQRIASMAARRGRDLGLELQDGLVVQGDSERLERIIGHVVQNAFDATRARGQVWIKLGRFGNKARIEVGDTGEGMSPEFLRDRLFKPFQTTKPAGSGIGSYEALQYVRELGGTITASSTPDRGTEMVVLLPLARESQRGAHIA